MRSAARDALFSSLARRSPRTTSPSLAPRATGHARLYSDASTSEAISSSANTSSTSEEGWLFVDSVFPTRLGTWDLRYHIGYAREESLLARLSALFSKVDKHGFRVLSYEPHAKDGGVFVKFAYNANTSESTLDDLLETLRDNAVKHGGVPSWFGLPHGNIWLVKGRPWREDLMRYPSNILKVAFDGPDVPEETVYNLLRPYGRIADMQPPTPVPAGTLRSMTVIFRQVRASVSSKNTLHSLTIYPAPGSTTPTRLRLSYQPPIQPHVVRDYINNHPKIFLPVFLFLLGTLTYTIFDPVRIFMVEGKMNDWFDYRQYRLFQWVRANTVERLSFSNEESSKETRVENVWKERLEAQEALSRYFSDMPATIAFIHGPQGSGKSRLLNSTLEEKGRKALVIDVGELSKAGSESALISGLANQTGYWPVFSFLNSMNNLIDLASVGLIGQKTGLSATLDDQLKQILEVVGTGLRRVNTSYKEQRERQRKQQQLDELKRQERARIKQRIEAGTWHDGRLDCIAGNGPISELGIGDEWFGEQDADKITVSSASSSEEAVDEKNGSGNGTSANEEARKKKTAEDLQAIESMPVVVIKNFESKGGDAKKEELLNILSQWAASLVENQVAHVVVVSANRENAKRIAKALPSKPLSLIALSDADNASALSFVHEKLHDVDVNVDLTAEDVAYVQRLGGRASDLESLIHKVRSGQSIPEAVEDIIARGVSELRKNAFGDDLEDAKNLPWSREQAWTIMKRLATKPEACRLLLQIIPYHDVLMDYPFKGDETALRNMEHSELISIGTQNGRPSSIRPGKPVYRYVFERLVHDPVFNATQEMSINAKLIAAAETTIKACEDELLALNNIDQGTSHWWGPSSAVKQRRDHLLKNMHAAESKIDTLEKQNAALKKVLAKGG
ncbi:hypothetical protein K474DRAFT_1592893 [Panus rudis PR-1116 ss-1]|nr:hypothetical protein K474DRAFT_1592893 [Panus rudis PR-1116 ss-1]